jgi:hypothetical protein
VPAWVIDLVTAALGSTAANGLGCGLLAYGAHHTRRQRTSSLEPEVYSASPQLEPATRKKKEHAAHFAVHGLRPATGEERGPPLVAIQREYGRWCEEKGLQPLSPAQIGLALAELFESAGISIAEHEGRLMAVGVSIKERSEPRALEVIAAWTDARAA